MVNKHTRYGEFNHKRLSCVLKRDFLNPPSTLIYLICGSMLLELMTVGYLSSSTFMLQGTSNDALGVLPSFTLKIFKCNIYMVSKSEPQSECSSF